MDALAWVEDAVRDRVRRDGIDPQVDVGSVRAFARSVVDSAPLDLPVPVDADDAVRRVVDAVAGFGPLQEFLDDPTVEEVWVNEPGRVFVARGGRSELTTCVLAPGVVEDLVERMLRSSGRRLDRSSPFVDAALPDGSRLHVVVPDVTREHWAVNIRKFVAPVTHLEDLVAVDALSHQAAALLRAAVVSGLSIVVSGATQAGKTTVLGALLNALPSGCRLVTCEEVFELRPALPDVVAMQTRQPNLEGSGEIPLRRLVKEALRMRPGALAVGEVRQGEALDLLVALNAGVPGLCTVHASSAREAVVKLCTLPLLAGENVTSAFVVPTVAAAVDLVVHVATDAGGRRYVHEVAAVPGRVENGVVEVADLFHDRDGRLVRGDGYPPHAERFRRAGFDLAALLADESERAGR